MSLSMGIVGLPNVGKSTLFNALTNKSAPAENYPFCTIDPSVGVVTVPDERVGKLADFSESAKRIPAIMEFVDIAGLVKGASAGEGLGNKFLSNIRETDAILEVVRIFEDSDITHVDGKVDPVNDIEVINLELVLADFQTVSKRLGNIERDVKRGDKEAVVEKEALQKIEKVLDDGGLASSTDLNESQREIVKSMHLITMKPILYALNKKAGGKNLDEMKDERFGALIKFLENTNSKYVIFDAKVEDELKDFEGEEKETFRDALMGGAPTPNGVGVPTPDAKSQGVGRDGIDNLIKKSYELLGLITYFTTGADETRAWTILKDSSAPVAGQAIHTDFKDKFIRAEVVNWQDLLNAGSMAGARDKGLIRTEGKEYIVKDGDVVEFRI